MASDGTFVSIVLILAISVALPAWVIVAIYAAKHLSPKPFSPVVLRVLVAVVALMVVGALLFLLLMPITSLSIHVPIPTTGDHQATPLPRSSGMADDESCWYAEPAVDSRSLVNIPQWRYVQRVEWCGDGSRIVGAPVHRRSWDTLAPFWTFERHRDVSEGEWGPERYHVFSQAKFMFCTIPQVLCLNEENPSLGMAVYGNGTFYAERDGRWTGEKKTVEVVRTSVWEALLMALAGMLAASPLAAGLIVGGFVAIRSKLDVVRSVGVGMLAGGTTLMGIVAAIALLFA